MFASPSRTIPSLSAASGKMSASREMATMSAAQLPSRLLNFFAKYPPPQLRAVTATSAAVQTTSNTSSTDPNVAAVTESLSQTSMTDSATGVTDKSSHNPFLPFKNPRTGIWHGPAYSLRRQAELYKLADKYHVLPLMPIAPKHPEVKAQKRIERGLAVQGTGEGKRVKGKLWERQLRSKLEERRKAMEGMNAMIVHWKERGHGRGWKKWPK
ncbi:hypothetical protein CB0940_11135 [Cercospora beticola]|uniref:Large ribosomal subunit protein mL59 domain-containing protein n=2 Tax=Cercospora beticola TaxID=122368 RepID=A0A2G5HEI6_CERBT|nr:hypothetical protein CB0940_11135 [Cercospora beticola]PIA90966.1 hypothetical protein CB0940_11135 [Cercospora beticola]